MAPAFNLVLESAADGHEVWRGPLPPHVFERLIAETHLAGILAGALPNDGLPIRLDRCDLAASETGSWLVVEVASGGATFRKEFAPSLALQDDAEVIVARLVATKVLAAGTYRFRAVPALASPERAGSVRVAPLPRRLAPLPRRSLWAAGLTALPRCRHPTILLPSACGEALVAQARASATVEVGALLVVEPFFTVETPPCRLGIRILDAVPLAHGTIGTQTELRVTPEALAAIPVDEEHGRCRGGIAHSHPFGENASPHFLSASDKAFATAWFWRPFAVQIVIDPRFTAPGDAFAAYCWIGGALARVCLQLVEEIHQEEIACPQSVPLS